MPRKLLHTEQYMTNRVDTLIGAVEVNLPLTKPSLITSLVPPLIFSSLRRHAWQARPSRSLAANRAALLRSQPAPLVTDSQQAARQQTTHARPVQVVPSMRSWMRNRASCGQPQPVRSGRAMRPAQHLQTLPARRAVQARTLQRMIRLRARLIRPRRVPRGHH